MRRVSLFLLLLACSLQAQDPAAFLNRLTPWTENASAVSGASLTEVIFHNGQFLAASDTNHVFISPDGIEWEQVETGISGYAIAAGSDGYVIVGARWDEEAGKAVAAAVHSPDGREWTLEELPPDLPTLTAVAYGNDMWLAVGRAGAIARRSLEGKWEVVAPWALYPNTYFSGLSFGEGAFIATTYSFLLLRSTDGGDTWMIIDVGFSQIRYQNGIFLAFGDSISHSKDGGTRWISAESLRSTQVRSISYDGTYFFAVGTESVDGVPTTYDYASTDGVGWTKAESAIEKQQNSIVQGAGKAVVVGIDGLVRTSSLYFSKAEIWLRDHLANASDGQLAFAADPDQDGLLNLAEYAFGLRPDNAASASPIVLRTRAGDEARSAVATCRSDDPDLIFTCYSSSNLRDWRSDTLSFDAESDGWTLASSDLRLEFTKTDTDQLWKLTLYPNEPGADIFIRIGVEHRPQ